MPNDAEDLNWVKGRLGLYGRLFLGVVLMAAPVVLIVLIVRVWPHATVVTAAPGSTPPVPPQQPWVFDGIEVNAEQSLILVMALLGALGGALHALGSFTVFVGNRRLFRSWVWWYLARAPIGGTLAVTVYFVLRGGLLSSAPGGSGGSLNPYGLAAFALLAGLSSEIATQKLRELFEVLFRPAEQKKDPLDAGAPELTGLVPNSARVGADTADLTVRGQLFRQGDVVFADDRSLTTAFHSDHELAATLPRESLAAAGQIAITVHRAQPRPIVSNALTLAIVPDPVPGPPPPAATHPPVA